jgi:ABC-type phosphate transport system substrate-binding protein
VEDYIVKTARLLILLISIAATTVPCLAHHMAVVVSENNAVGNLTSSQLGKIFRAEMKKWPDGSNIVVVLHRSSSGENMTLQHLNKMSAAQLQAWSKQHKEELKFADSDADVLSIVQSTPGAVGLIDVRAVTYKVKVLHVDGKLPLEERYLSH